MLMLSEPDSILAVCPGQRRRQTLLLGAIIYLGVMFLAHKPYTSIVFVTDNNMLDR